MITDVVNVVSGKYEKYQLAPNKYGFDLIRGFMGRKGKEEFYWEDVEYFELKNEQNSIRSSGGGLGRAAVGGVLFGFAGAAAGAQKDISSNQKYLIEIGLKNGEKFLVETSGDGGFYNMLLKKVANSSAPKQFDPIEQLKKYKELLDLGIITSEEFEEKKKELLK